MGNPTNTHDADANCQRMGVYPLYHSASRCLDYDLAASAEKGELCIRVDPRVEVALLRMSLQMLCAFSQGDVPCLGETVLVDNRPPGTVPVASGSCARALQLRPGARTYTVGSQARTNSEQHAPSVVDAVN